MAFNELFVLDIIKFLIMLQIIIVVINDKEKRRDREHREADAIKKVVII